jgi:hypothetical protein
MSKLIVLTTDESTKEQRDAFTNYLQTTNHGFWHWFPEVWIVDPAEQLEAAALRGKAREHMPSAAVLVLRFDCDADWAGFLTETQVKWLRKHL